MFEIIMAFIALIMQLFAGFTFDMPAQECGCCHETQIVATVDGVEVCGYCAHYFNEQGENVRFYEPIDYEAYAERPYEY